MSDTYTQRYSNFIGVDLSSDPRAVARNRLAYAVNMWRDYESEQGEAIETFPGFRRLVRDLGAVHGLFAYRAKSGEEYLIVHAGKRLYSFESEAVAAMDDVHLTENAALDKVELEDGDSQGFIFNNNLYILDGKHFVVVSGVTDQSGAVSVTASEVDAYVPTTYLNGKPYEQRNMLVDEAYEIITKENYYYGYTDEDDVKHNISASWQFFVDSDPEYGDAQKNIVKGFRSGCGMPSLNIDLSGKAANNLEVVEAAFADRNDIQSIDIRCKTVKFCENSFANCKKLASVKTYLDWEIGNDPPLVVIDKQAFAGCESLKEFRIYTKYAGLPTPDVALPDGISLLVIQVTEGDPDYDHHPADSFNTRLEIGELAETVINAKNNKNDSFISCAYKGHSVTVNGEKINAVQYVYVIKDELKYDEENADDISPVKIKLRLYPLHFSTIENVKSFYDGNPDYRGTGVEAINGCTKSAVFDGRIVLTGNPALPNTVFYSNRNLTGANDPTYWGAYNYFNDGDGNTPNVDLLSTPSMLMVLKNNTVQDGSVYYHTAAYNEDEYSRDLVPRIYPSTSGAAGLGSAGKTVPGTTACNFLDDPVFLSTRGLEAVGKQTVNLERTLTHRSSNVDRFLIIEDLSRASLAEWKGYLVICCDGRFYLADSRQIHQHPDGSYQYEWYYLEGLGCYDEYSGGYRYINDWFGIDDNGNTLDQCTLVDGRLIGEAFATSDGEFEGDTGDITVYSAQRPDGSQFYFYAHGNLALEAVDEERCGVGEFYPARKIVVVGERLFFGTADGDVCVINTDKRGVPDYEGQDIEPNRISTRWYSFAGVRYSSLCATVLDDCTKPMLAKGTIPGTAVARFKMMPGSRVCANVSVNGRDFKKVGEAYASRYDAGSLDFSNFSFTENEDARIVLREFTRNWVDKQYSFVSDGFCEPFGIYEVSYLYVTKGKIRRPFAVIERK